MARQHRLEHYENYIEEEHASSEYAPVFTGNASYTSTYSPNQRDPQTYGLAPYQQVATSPWLPIDTGYQASNAPSLSTAWGDATTDMQNPFGGSAESTRASRSTAGSSSIAFQGYSQGFNSSQNQNTYEYDYDQMQSGNTNAQRGATSGRRRTAASEQPSTSQSRHRIGARSGDNRTSTSGQSYGSEYYTTGTTGQQQGFGSSLADFPATGAQYDFPFQASTYSTGASRGGPLMTTGHSTWDSPSLTLTSSSGDPFATTAGTSSQATTIRREVSDDGSSDSEGFADPGASSSQRQSLSPMPPSKGKQRASSSKDSGAEPLTLRCTFEGCSSKVVFTRHCDLAKHYRQHFRKYTCRIEGCSASAGFATKKDRARHERTHNPDILCEHCGRKFSRQDNLRDHVRRRH